jgi:hypothetical protein
MNEYDFGSGEWLEKRNMPRNLDGKIQYLLSAEQELLQSISAGAPLPRVLNGICSALDCQIGNVVSLISLPEKELRELPAIAMNATLFGLYTFYSEGIFSEDKELIGSIELYSCVARGPSSREVQLIERATCLAVIAIKLDKAAGSPGDYGIQKPEPVRARVLEWPGSMN